MKGGTSWISRKGEILKKKGGGGVDQEKGGMTPLTNYGEPVTADKNWKRRGGRQYRKVFINKGASTALSTM